MRALARDLAVQSDDCPTKLPDGSCPDEVSTRQIILPGAKNAAKATGSAAQTAVRTAAKAIRQNISMTFLLGSAELTADAKAKLDWFARELKSVGSYRPFTVEGHTDRSGSWEINRNLSQARASSVVDYLASKGVDRARMTAKGYGYDRLLPGVDARSPANRRVEITAK